MNVFMSCCGKLLGKDARVTRDTSVTVKAAASETKTDGERQRARGMNRDRKKRESEGKMRERERERIKASWVSISRVEASREGSLASVEVYRLHGHRRILCCGEPPPPPSKAERKDGDGEGLFSLCPSIPLSLSTPEHILPAVAVIRWRRKEAKRPAALYAASLSRPVPSVWPKSVFHKLYDLILMLRDLQFLLRAASSPPDELGAHFNGWISDMIADFSL